MIHGSKTRGVGQQVKQMAITTMTYEPILHALQELVQRRVASNLPPTDAIKKQWNMNMFMEPPSSWIYTSWHTSTTK